MVNAALVDAQGSLLNWDLIRSITDFLYGWQTLAGAFTALLAAWLTVRTIRRQIEEEKVRHRELLEREERAARARLNDAHSALCRFASGSVKRAMNRHRLRYDDLPHEAMKTIQDAIEKVDSKTAHSLSELVSHYQIHNARLLDLDDSEIKKEVNTERLYDSIFLYALADHFFDYARKEVSYVESVDISRERMLSCMRITLGIANYHENRANFAELEDMIQRRHE